MNKMIILLLLLPLGAVSQCPKWVGESPEEVKSLMGLMEQKLSFKFIDSSINSADRIMYKSADGRFVIQLTHNNGVVQNINLEAPTNQMEEFVNWFKKVFEECEISTEGPVVTYENFAMLSRPVNNTRSYFYISKKEE